MVTIGTLPYICLLHTLHCYSVIVAGDDFAPPLDVINQLISVEQRDVVYACHGGVLSGKYECLDAI